MGEGRGSMWLKQQTQSRAGGNSLERLADTPPWRTANSRQRTPLPTAGIRRSLHTLGELGAMALGKKQSLWGEKQHAEKREIQGKGERQLHYEDENLTLWTSKDTDASSLYSWIEFIPKVVNCQGAESCLSPVRKPMLFFRHGVSKDNYECLTPPLIYSSF